MNVGHALLLFLIFPGFLFTAVLGLLVSWLDRKVTARVQWRVGPPFYQGFADFFKLLGKETIIPEGASRLAFLGAPLMGVAAVTLASTILIAGMVWPNQSFAGDLIVVFYLLAIPSLAIIIGGAASKNALASLGASREMKLVLSYELPLILAILVPVIQSGGRLRIGELAQYQMAHGSFAWSLSGVIALLVCIMCLQGKLGLVPFDQAEAETEIMGGALIEYSGAPLAMFKLQKAMMLVAMPVFILAVLWGGLGNTVSSFILGLIKYLVLIVLVTLIRNTNPRVRIDHVMKFFWGLVSVFAVLAVILAVLGV